MSWNTVTQVVSPGAEYNEPNSNTRNIATNALKKSFLFRINMRDILNESTDYFTVQIGRCFAGISSGKCGDFVNNFTFEGKYPAMTEIDQQYSKQYYQPPQGSQTTPNRTEVMVLGILSIVFCWCWGILSAILGIVTLVLASQGEKQYRLNPALYSEVSYRNLRTGKTCAIVGLCLAALTIISAIIYFILFGSLIFNVIQSGWNY